MTRLVRQFAILSFAAATATPALAQFLISVQQNNQAFGVSDGGSITMNAPAVGQTASATVTLTNLGSVTAAFGGLPQILGSGAFTTDVSSPISISTLGSTTFHIQFTPTSSAQDVSQFNWTYSVASATPGGTAGNGVINFTLIGTTPSITVNTVLTSGTYSTIPNAGTFQFAPTQIGSSSSLTVAISNSGSGSTTVTSITVAGSAFQAQGVTLLPLTLNAGSEMRFTIQFSPASVGTQTGTLQIALGTGPYSASLAGNGTASSSLTYQITQDGKTSALTPNQTITFDDTQVGATSSVVIQFQNASTANLVVGSLGVNGTGFTFTDGPFLPLTLLPQQTNSISLAYSPTQAGPSTGRLLIGSDTFLLSATALGPVFQFTYQVSDAASQPVVAGGLVSFSPITVGQTESLLFTITNTGTAAGPVQSLGVSDTSGVFKISNQAALPVQLAPGSSTSITVTFAPTTTGLNTSALIVNNQTFVIGGFSSAPPALPAYQFTPSSGTQQPLTQPAVGLSLNTAYSQNLTGALTISTASSSFAADPAVQFATGGTKVAFTIPANTLQAVFPNGSKTIQLQTGTVAGAINIQPDFMLATGFDVTPTNPATLQITVPSQAPTISSATIGSQTTTGFSISIIGFTTTRNLDHVNLQFTPASGFAFSGNTITVDVSSAARLYFLSAASANAGGQFNLEIPFTLAGGNTGTNLTSSVGAISLLVANNVGNSTATVINP